jgi:hypothetical protein
MKTQKLIHRNFTQKLYSYESALCNWSGLLVSVSLIAFFLFMKAFGLYEVLSFRYFNFVFLLTGILTTFYNYKKKVARDGIDYFTGIKMGIRITLIAVVPFVFFMAIYLYVDKEFMNYIRGNAEFGRYLSPFIASGAVGIEGFVSGGITTFAAMQYFKSNS